MKNLVLMAILALPMATMAQMDDVSPEMMPVPMEMEEMQTIIDLSLYNYQEMANLYYDGMVMYDQLPEYVQQRVLRIDQDFGEKTFVPKMAQMRMDMEKKSVHSRGRMLNSRYMSPQKREIRSYRDQQASRFRPYARKSFGKNPFTKENMGYNNNFRGGVIQREEKNYLVRRSYYYFDKRDEQTADYVRLLRRIRGINPPADMVYSEEDGN